VAAIEGNHDVRVESFGEGDDGGVRSPEREVGILLNERGDAQPIFGMRSFDLVAAQAAQKACFGDWAATFFDEIGRLGHNHCGDDQSNVRTLE
jgi:hypothetical protein